jgi:hypothetical protein
MTKDLAYCPIITYTIIDVDTSLEPDTDIFSESSN